MHQLSKSMINGGFYYAKAVFHWTLPSHECIFNGFHILREWPCV